MSVARHRSLPVALLLVGEVIAVAAAYQALNPVDCAGTGAYGACRFLRSLVARALVLFAAGALVAFARPGALSRLAEGAALHPSAKGWALAHLAGMALLALPIALAGGAPLTGAFAAVAPVLAAGALLAALGGLFWLAPPRAWAALLRSEPVVLPAALATALLLPDLADLAQPLWGLQGLTALTFHAVSAVLRPFGETIVLDEAAYVLGIDGFVVQIGRACSGVEGFALIGGFVTIYAALFRVEVRVGRVFAVLLPAGLLLSWSLNVVRIAALILIGARVSPDLAVNGFHSYAGWLFFLTLAMGLLYAAHTIGWFQRARPLPAERGPAAPPLREDRLAAFILPFVAFMAAGVAAGAFFPHPELGYPLKAAVMAAALWYFLPAFRRLEWEVGAVPVAAGVAVAALWIALAPSSEGDDALATALAGFGPGAFVLWVGARVVGTVVLVPVVEEAFFRGYVLARIDRLWGGGPVPRILAVAMSTALFAVMHGRWLAAGAAGLVFAALMLRRGRLADAITAHAVANALVAAWAATLGDWAMI